MTKKILIGLIRWAFITASISLLAPLVLPYFHFHGGLLGATISGAALLGLYPLMRIVIYKALGLVEGACPMPGVQKWLVLSFWAGTAAAIWIASLIAPAWLQCGGILGAIPAGFIVLAGTVVANIFTRPLSAEKPGADETKK